MKLHIDTSTDEIDNMTKAADTKRRIARVEAESLRRLLRDYGRLMARVGAHDQVVTHALTQARQRTTAALVEAADNAVALHA